MISVTVFAQTGNRKEKMEQVKSLKVAFITNELNLTSGEAAKFWPIYNAYEDKQKELRKQKVGSYMDRKNNNELDKLSDKEANSALQQMESAEEELFQLRKKFISNLRGVIPAIKILKLKKAEDEFNRKLLKQYRDKKGKQ